MKIIKTTTVYKSGARKGLTRSVCEPIAESLGDPVIDFDTGEGSIKFVSPDGNDLLKLIISPKEMADFIGAIPMGLVLAAEEKSRTDVMRGIKAITALFKEKVSKKEKEEQK